MPKKTKSTKLTDANKAWNRRPAGSPVRLNQRAMGKAFLIICEGENTEPLYFKSFPIGNADVESYGLGSSKTALVKLVLDILKGDKTAKEKEVWVVFDMDIKEDQLAQQKQDFNNAVHLAKSKGLKVAFSNDAFELWFLLHYQDLKAQWSRHQYYDSLSRIWGCNYVKEGKQMDFCRKIYQRLLEDTNSSQEIAIQRAAQLLQEQEGLAAADKNPCTAVFELVEALNQYL